MVNLAECLRVYEFTDRLNERGQHFVPVADDTIGTRFEYIGVLITVDGDNVFSALATGHMLAGAGYSNSDVKIRCYRFPSQAHLVAVIEPSCVARCPGCAHSATEH